MTSEPTPRRSVLLAGAGSVAALAATGCGSDSDSGGAATPTPTTARPTSPETSASPTGLPTGPTSASPPVPGELARTSEIPVGGGKVFADRKVVVTQPEAGEFKAFSAICTHQGCTVNKVADGTIDCPCHGSKYRIADGSVAAGPAPRPLPAEQITVSGNSITLDG
ncbi:Rieske (2Fe-2S) protein [Streptomyces solicathayae]|uniref:Cytochrome bc1 complex Rieske iron-sulfur subunit n=1 Tax=Streptomyces solicathayae TaxID=3081768 RepID=A0ABZ0M0D1_9ACTN|nr:Rieske (2Fe-2S) protein [Streptomyces sp. HUAS YS2]WOX25222.1 Rieske (2Fe-2S) protein [Streptomyces sp. HUAS YS2]